MERWELKVLCAALALLVSVVCTFLPFLLIYINCSKLKKTFTEKRKKWKLCNLEDIEKGSQFNAESASRVADGSDDNSLYFHSHGHPEEIMSNVAGGQVEGKMSGYDAKILGHLMCFGGGVFLGTFLLHMVPEVTEILLESMIRPLSINYPLAELIIGIGFFIILFVDEVVNSCQRMKSLKQVSSRSDHFPESHGKTGHLEEVSIDINLESSKNQREGTNHHHYSTRSIVLVLALSLHHIFEGFSIGLQKYYNNVWHLTVAVLCHETVISFSMGLQFYKDDRKLNRKVFAILIIAASIMPLGIVIGIALSEANQNGSAPDPRNWQNVLNGVLQGLACGTFLYVTFLEILCDELVNGNSTPSKVLCVAFGFGLMALLGLIPETSTIEDRVT